MQALRDNNEEKFIGAYVKEPIVGKYDWIYDLDLTSLYPSIIMSLNISPETKIGKIENWDAEKYIKGGETDYRLIGKDGVKNLMVTRIGLQVRFTNAETGVVFGASRTWTCPITSGWCLIWIRHLLSHLF